MLTVLILVLVALVVAAAVFGFDGGPRRVVRRTIVDRPVRRVVERPVRERVVEEEPVVERRVVRE